MIAIDNIHKSFNSREVLRGVTLQVDKGDILAVIGGSGAGKSVLLKHIAALMRPDRGSISVDGITVPALRGRELESYRARLGFLFQGGALFDSMTVYENISFPLHEKTKLKEKEIRDKVFTMLGHVGMLDEGDKFPAELSGGMKKRAALARALITSPEIMLFDEPTTGLDPIIVNNVFQYIKSTHVNLGFTGVIVTHEIPKIFSIVQRVALLIEGKIVAAGTPDEIQTSNDPVLKHFLSGGVEGENTGKQ